MSQHCGFALFKLQIVIAVLIGLLLLAVQNVRKTTTQIKCHNNLRQIALTTINLRDFEGAFLPARITERPSEWPITPFKPRSVTEYDLRIPLWK